ncbi:hypothetical protein [Glaciimonas soli]|uniref:Uncharacterized protein n=1 Tax=Glaciimonas soli TaxID=2590999 RepID=A0A843YWR2_9BURK|nr:hypothetical protein [Glaciimonas soli]MQR02114.1 hypothetical protein [Glaciimonas soli]
MSINKRNKRSVRAEAMEMKTVGTKTDFSSDFEQPLAILTDLIAIAIEEIGNGSGRALSVLLPAMRYVHDIKAINDRLLQVESTK